MTQQMTSDRFADGATLQPFLAQFSNFSASHRPAKPQHPAGVRVFPALFISDMHLGAHSCKAEALLSFLQTHSADTIYLVGDIFDVWRPMGSNWKATHHAILTLLLDRVQQGVRVVYTPGNHDAFFRNYFGTYFGCIEVADYVFHTAADGQRYLVIHGDSCDVLERRAPVLSKIGAHCESVLRGVQLLVNRGLTAMGRADWSGVDYLLEQVNHLLRSTDQFQARLSQLALDHQADGIICGHFHQAALHNNFGVTYANCGDWTESCTALAETSSGRLVQLDWAVERQSVAARAGTQAEAVVQGA